MKVDVTAVASPRDLDAFIELPYRLYRNEPNWVAPLRFERREFLDPRRNPFFEHADAQLFVARRGEQVVGRISAHIDHNFNAFQNHRWGLFGFFECEDDAEVASALVAVASRWLSARGRDRIVGPMDFTTNDELGVLIEGHELVPAVLTPWTHRYYPGLLERVGLSKAHDLLMWELRIEGRDRVHPAIWKTAEEVERRHGITVRPMRKRHMAAEIDRFRRVYNVAWANNWAFVPLTEAQAHAYARTLRPLLDEHWAFVAEKDGEVLGAALTLPDFNQVLSHLNGRLLPVGWAKALYWRRKIDRVRVFALGVMPEWQHAGIGARFYQLHYQSAEVRPQKWGEMGWILETNTAMNRAMEGMGGRIVRRFRIYERELASA